MIPMTTQEKIVISTLFFIAFVLFFPSPSLAIPGQLIYDVPASAPAPIQTITTQCDKAPLVACTTLSQSCLLKKGDLEKANAALAANLAEEKKKGVMMEVAGGILIGAIGVLIFLLWKKPSPSETSY